MTMILEMPRDPEYLEGIADVRAPGRSMSKTEFSAVGVAERIWAADKANASLPHLEGEYK